MEETDIRMTLQYKLYLLSHIREVMQLRRKECRGEQNSWKMGNKNCTQDFSCKS